MNNWQYKYIATVMRVVDENTVDCLVDLGLYVLSKQRLSLYGINTIVGKPEVRGEEREDGLSAKEALVNMIEGKQVVVEIFKDDKTGRYGRYLATIWLVDGPIQLNMNDWLVQQGHAEYVEH